MLAHGPNPKLEDHTLSAVRDCLFITFAATLRIWGRSFWGSAMPWWQGPTCHRCESVVYVFSHAHYPVCIHTSSSENFYTVRLKLDWDRPYSKASIAALLYRQFILWTRLLRRSRWMAVLQATDRATWIAILSSLLRYIRPPPCLITSLHYSFLFSFAVPDFYCTRRIAIHPNLQHFARQVWGSYSDEIGDFSKCMLTYRGNLSPL